MSDPQNFKGNDDSLATLVRWYSNLVTWIVGGIDGWDGPSMSPFIHMMHRV